MKPKPKKRSKACKTLQHTGNISAISDVVAELQFLLAAGSWIPIYIRRYTQKHCRPAVFSGNRNVKDDLSVAGKHCRVYL